MPPRAIATAALALYALQFVALDAWTRGLSAWKEPRVLVSLVESATLWSLVVLFATTRARRLVAALVAATLFVVQALVFRYYRMPLDVQVAESAIHAWRDVRPVVLRAAPVVTLSIGAVALVLYRALAAAHRDRSLDPRIKLFAVSVLALAGLFGEVPRRATPEIRALHGLSAIGRARPKPVLARVTLPALRPEKPLPNVLFVISESIRASAYDETTSPETLAVLPSRAPLREMRAVSSYTALSVSALLTGRAQHGPREPIQRAPTLFHYAHAAGYEVGYWSAQSAEIVETSDVRAVVDHFVTGETLIGKDPEDEWESPLDDMIVGRFCDDTAETGGRPRFAVLHLTGTHAPYHVDPEHAPFAPYDHVVTWSGMPKLLNAYKNAIVAQDRALARATKAFVDRSSGRPWIVLFTSDHGEAFGEHGAIHHGQNLYDEQVHVPAWIAVGGGALGDRERRALADHERAFVTHLDLVPTVLDAMGLWDNSAILAHQSELQGRSLFAARAPRSPIPVTNCTSLFRCPINTWGIYEDGTKLVADPTNGGWMCLVTSGGERIADAGDRACDRVRDVSRRYFPLMPNGTPNR